MAGLETAMGRVVGHLNDLGVSHEPAEDGAIKVPAGSTAVYIDVQDLEGSAVVRMVAPVLADVPADPERLVQLLQINADLTFGKFSWDPEHRLVTVDYELLGDVIDAEEVQVALDAVKRIADTCDDRLRPRLGGHLPHG